MMQYKMLMKTKVEIHALFEKPQNTLRKKSLKTDDPLNFTAHLTHVES